MSKNYVDKTGLSYFWSKIKAILESKINFGSIVNNCTSDRADLPLAAAQGKELMGKYTQLNSDLSQLDNCLKNERIFYKNEGTSQTVIGSGVVLSNEGTNGIRRALHYVYSDGSQSTLWFDNAHIGFDWWTGTEWVNMWIK